MEHAQELEHPSPARPPALLRGGILLALGWTLLALSALLSAFLVLWMWRRLGSGAPMVAIALAMEASVGIGLIIAGRRARRNSQQS